MRVCAGTWRGKSFGCHSDSVEIRSPTSLMWVVAVASSILLAYTPSARTSGDRPGRSLRDWVRDHLKSIVAAAMAYCYYVAAAWLAGAEFPQFLRDHPFDG